MRNAAEDRFQTLHEIIAAARLTLNQNLWDYVVGGTETETTLKRNRLALDRIGFRPRVLADVSQIDTSTEFLGHRVRLPVALAPVGGLEQLGGDGGVTVAQGAGLAEVPFFLSSVTQTGLERTAAAASGCKVFQLYVRGDDSFVDDHVHRAVDAGYDAFCITVDSAIYSRRERDIANRFAKPWRARSAGMEFQAGLSWAHMERFKRLHTVKLILKGIATPEDAVRAVELGVEGIYVSNHGGRQLDHGAGSMDVLPEVIDAIDGRAMVMVDGGISRGSDVVKAIALGADLVGIGRLYVYGLAAAGAEGIRRVIELLEEEVAECLGLLGVRNFGELDRSYLRAVEAVAEPHVHSAFPLLTLPQFQVLAAMDAPVALPAGPFEAASPAPRRMRLAGGTVWTAWLLLVLAFLVIYPVCMLLIGALTGGDPVVDGYRLSAVSLDNFVAVLLNPNVHLALLNSLITCTGGTAVAVAIGLLFAWIVVRTDTPLKGLIAAAGMIPLFVPPLVGGVAWAILGSPKTGLLNTLMARAGLDWRINLYSMSGIVFVFGMYYAPYVYMFTSAALRNMDPSLEEAAEMSGASSARTIFTVTFPLIAPAIVSGMLLSFVVMLGIYGIPAVLGAPANIPVLTTYIYTLTNWSPPLYGTAASVAIILMAVTGLLVLAQNKILAGRSYTTVAGKAFRPRSLRLGPWRFATLGLAVLYVLVVVVLPTLALIVAAFRKFLFVRDVPSLFDGRQVQHCAFRATVRQPADHAGAAEHAGGGADHGRAGRGAGVRDRVHGDTDPGAGTLGGRRRVDGAGGDSGAGDRGCVSLGLDRVAGRDLWDDLDLGAGFRRAVHSGHGQSAQHFADADPPGAGGGGVDLRALAAGHDRERDAAAGAAGRDGGDDASLHPVDARAGFLAIPVFERVDGDVGAAARVLRGREFKHHRRL